MTQKSELGKYGEDLACEYLVQRSYKIIARNYRKPWGELDVIAKDKDGTLVFVEVKTMRQSIRQAHDKFGNPSVGEQIAEQNTGLTPEDQMSSSKMRKFKRTAEEYAIRNESLVGKRGWQCDVIALTVFEKDFTVSHYKNV